jgi:hypothetical protein
MPLKNVVSLSTIFSFWSKRDNNWTVSDVKLECLQHEVVPRFLSEKLMEQNRLKNIPPLTPNQQFLIARLVWYQDGYEQPSDEDLKRVTQVNIYSKYMLYCLLSQLNM